MFRGLEKTNKVKRITIAAVIFVAISCFALTSSAEVHPSAFEYMGYMLPPNDPGGHTYNWNNSAGLEIAEDCMGYSDPSPSDGYPGCMLAYMKQTPERWVGLFDLVPSGQQATQIVRWSPFGQFPEDNYPIPFAGGLDRPTDLLYYNENGQCHLYWGFTYDYANGMQVGVPFLGVSSCDPNNPSPVGMWGYPDVDEPENHPNKFNRNLGIIPESIADALFDGNRMLIGQGKGTGTRGSSGGPSATVRPLELPSSDLGDFTPLLWYRAHGYPCWAERQDFRLTMTLPNGEQWEAPFNYASADIGGEFIDIDGEFGYVTSMTLPIYNPEAYPYNQANTIYHQGDLRYPDLRDTDGDGLAQDRLAMVYYGQETCDDTDQPPSFQEIVRETDPDRMESRFCDPTENMPADCNIVADCHGGAGPHANNQHSLLVFYDPADFAAVYNGEIDPWTVLPSGFIDITEVQATECDWHWAGMTYDAQSRTLYLASGGHEARYHMWRVGESDMLLRAGFDGGTLDEWTGVGDEYFRGPSSE